LHFKKVISGKNKPTRSCFIIFGNCMRPFSNYSATETKVVDINFLKERVLAVYGSVQWRKRC
jgi:hypothetical protein